MSTFLNQVLHIFETLHSETHLTFHLGPTELLLRLNCTGLCMSDVHYMLNDLPLPKQMQEFGVFSPGHEGAGVVVKVGTQVRGWKVGDRAGVKPMWDVCHSCNECWTGIEQWCRNRLNSGVEVTGTYQQYIVCHSVLSVFV